MAFNLERELIRALGALIKRTGEPCITFTQEELDASRGQVTLYTTPGGSVIVYPLDDTTPEGKAEADLLRAWFEQDF